MPPLAAMFFPFGGCRLFCAEREAGAAEPILALARSPGGEWLAALTASSLCVWSARQHRAALGHYPRHPASLESDGSNMQLCWHPEGHVLAVSTTKSFVYMYQVQAAAGDADSMSAEECARLVQGQFRVSISLTQKVQAAGQEGAATGAIAAGAASFWLGVAGGVLLAIEWTVQDPRPKKLFLPSEEGAAGGEQRRADVAAVCCSAALDLVVGLDSAGRAGYAFGAEGRSGAAAGEGAGEAAAVRALPLAEPGSALAVNSAQRRLCVGCVSGAIEVFRVRDRVELHRTTGEVGAGGCTAERRLTLAPWGIGPAETGAVAALAWSDDGLGLAAAYARRASPALWSLSGCCCSVAAGGGQLPAASSAGASDEGEAPPGPAPHALAWAADGLALWTACSAGPGPSADQSAPLQRAGGLLAEIPLLQPCAGRGPAQTEPTRRCFHTHDRVLVLAQHNRVSTGLSPQPDEGDGEERRAVSSVQTEFGWRQWKVPQKYLQDNWPVRHVSSSADGAHLAVSGAHGLTMLDTRSKRWRVFGDVSQERELRCVGLAWYRHIVVVYALAETAPAEDNIWGDASQIAARADETAV